MPGKRDLDPEMSPLHFFGAEVRRAREAAGVTLADLGAMVPCDASTVSRIESGQLSPAERFAERAMRHSRRWADGSAGSTGRP